MLLRIPNYIIPLLLTVIFVWGVVTPHTSFAQQEQNTDPSAGSQETQDGTSTEGNQGSSASVSGIGSVIVGCTGITSALGSALGSLFDNVPTDDTKNNTKERCEDGIAHAISSMLLQMFTQSIVNWINSGFEGDPLFIENPEAFFGDVANEISGIFIAELGASAICEPFRPQITIALAQQDSFLERSQCTLLDAIDNFDAFVNDFESGGWQGWIALTQQPQNNPYGAYFMAVDEHNRRLARGVQDARDQAQWADGFWPMRECVEYGEVPGPASGGPGASPGALEDQRPCKRYETRTPGQLIAGQANFTLTIDGRKLLNADELNEALGRILDALINQLITSGFRSLTNDDGESTWIEHDEEKGQITEALTQVKENTVAYIENRRAAIEIMAETHGVLGEIIACREGQIQFSQVRNIRDQQRQLVSTMEEYEGEVQNIESKLPQIDQLIEEVNNAEIGTQITDVLTKYSKISGQFPSSGDVDQTLKDLQRHRGELEKAQEELELCQQEAETETPPIRVIIVEEEGEEGEEEGGEGSSGSGGSSGGGSSGGSGGGQFPGGGGP